MSLVNMMATEYRILVMVMINFSIGLVGGFCIKHSVCDDPDDILLL